MDILFSSPCMLSSNLSHILDTVKTPLSGHFLSVPIFSYAFSIDTYIREHLPKVNMENSFLPQMSHLQLYEPPIEEHK